MKDLQIKLQRCVIVLPENELMTCLALKPEVFQKAIGRGKAMLRTQQARQRQLKANAQGLDRWALYEILKRNDPVDNTLLLNVEGMDPLEMKEGLIEFLATRGK